MSVKQADLARAWGLSRGRVSQMVKSGMPLSSLAEAESWRLAHYGSAGRAGGSGNSNSIIDEGTDSNLPEKPPLVSAADLAREDFKGTLARLTKNEMIAWSMLARAVSDRNENEIQTRQRQYAAAADLRVKQEKVVDEILLRRRELVSVSEANELFGRHLHAIQMTLKTIPTRLAARCNPTDPTLAKQALHEAIAAIFKQLNTWEL